MENKDIIELNLGEPIIGALPMTVNKEELLSLFKIGSMSKQEHNMVEFVEKFLKEEKIEYTKDSLGNIYNFNYENMPMISAHLDTVQDETDAFGAKFAKIYDDKFIRSYGVLGGDDKCGVYICMELLREFRELNFCFCVQEEIGMIGSKFVAENEKEKLKKIAYGLIFDRRGSGDIICYQNDYGTKDFEEELKDVGKYYKYSPAKGFASDCNTFKEFFSCANLSCGYYNPHTKNEYVKIDEVENALNYAVDILYNVVDVFTPYKPTYSKTTYPSSYNGRRSWGYNDDYYDDYYYGESFNYKNKKKSKEEEKEKKKKKISYTLCDCCNKYKDTIEIKKLNVILCKDCAREIAKELIDIAYEEN